MKITEENLRKINGGGFFSLGFICGVGALITFLIGVVDGYVRPLECND